MVFDKKSWMKCYDKMRRKTFDGRCYCIFNNARGRARRSGKEFDITLEWVRERLSKGKCELTGIDFIYEKEKNRQSQPFAPSIDRIDSSKGYTKENTQFILWGINQAKSDMDMEEFKEFIYLIWEGMG